MIDHRKFLKRWCALCTLLPGLVVLAGCKATLEPDFPEASAGAGPAPSVGAAGAADAAPSTNPDNDRPELIHVGDSLTVNFSDLPNPQPQLQVQVDENGKITLIENEMFTAAGKTRAQLEKDVRDRYVPDKFKKMTVNIMQPERLFYVGGEVKNPNRQSYIGPITVLKAIQSAGDFTDFAQRKRVKLTRLNGKTFIINAIKAREDPKLDLPVFPGDTIHVPRRIF